jgi:hypothetical protein
MVTVFGISNTMLMLTGKHAITSGNEKQTIQK